MHVKYQIRSNKPGKGGPNWRGEGGDENLDRDEAADVKRREAEATIEDEKKRKQRRLSRAQQEKEHVGAQQSPTHVHHVARFTGHTETR